MDARLLLRDRRVLGETRFAELVIWQLPNPVSGSLHGYKYRLAFVVDGECVIRFDNEAGKGDHMHFRTREKPYIFSSLDQLVADFWTEIETWEPI